MGICVCFIAFSPLWFTFTRQSRRDDVRWFLFLWANGTAPTTSSRTLSWLNYVSLPSGVKIKREFCFYVHLLCWSHALRMSTGQLNYIYKVVVTPTVARVTNMTWNQFKYIKILLSFGEYVCDYMLATDMTLISHPKIMKNGLNHLFHDSMRIYHESVELVLRCAHFF